VTDHDWYFFKPGLDGLTDSVLFRYYHQALGLGPHDALRLQSQRQDADGTLHRRYQQLHQGVPVAGAILSTHGDGQQVRLVHGKLLPLRRLDVRPHLSSSVASERLMGHFPDHKMAWESPSWEQSRQRDHRREDESWRKPAQLMVLPSEGSAVPRLAYRFAVRSLVPDAHFEAWIDAQDGRLLKQKSLRRACQGVQLRGQTQYYGERLAEGRRRGFPHYDHILETCGAVSIETKRYARNSFGEPKAWFWLDAIQHRASHWDDHAVASFTAHWATRQAWDYFAEVHDWQGPDGQGGDVRVWVDWQPELRHPFAAFYEPDGARHYLYFGQHQGNTLATLDIAGHEYAHAVIEAACGLGYEREAGAWHEALADMFGVLLERRVLEGESDWQIGKEVGTLRDLSDPASYGQAAVYRDDPHWVDTQGGCDWDNDQCGIHTNSGVGGRWFYLLTSEGAQAHKNVFGLGHAEVGQILFRSLTHYLQPRSDYRDARLATIQAAVDLFGRCSNQVAQVRNAWAQVGIGRPNEQLCVQVSGPVRFCQNEEAAMYVFEAQSVRGAEIAWGLSHEAVQYHHSGPHREQLIITDLPDTLTQLSLTVHARLDSLQATQRLSIQTEICQSGQRQEVPLPEAESWTLYPNPTREEVSVFLPEGMYPASLVVRDPLGRTWRSIVLQDQQARVDLRAWPAGCYYLTLESPQGSQVKLLRVLE